MKTKPKRSAPSPDRAKTGSWWRSYGRLIRFVERRGTARVPAEHVERDFQLGQWVRTQRSRRLRLSNAQTEALAKLPGWVWDVGDAQWDKAYRLLLAYVRRHRSAVVPKGFVENGFKLGQWVKTQRVRKAGLSRERRKALEQLPGWVWSVNETKWDENYALLCRCYKREGGLRLSAGHVESGFAIGAWLYAQRRAYLDGKMPRRRQALLDQLSPEWKEPPRLQGRARGRAKPERFEKLDSTHQTEAVYEALFGMGPMTVQEAVLAAAEYLRNSGLADYRRFRTDGPLADAIRKAMNLSVRCGYFDRPRRGQIRAILPDPDDYQPEDWEFCLLQSLGHEPVRRELAVQRTLEFASENLGLRQKALKKSGPVHRKIAKVVSAALTRGQIRGAGEKKIQRIS